ncbi:vesicle-associated protein 3-1-like isoform X1 [Setaria viridis]|uniref:vesicle-associated protein 3-1-like isoform X1 n=2 Tax=Setaria viridis TaxID=4556 RepID=UPI003B3ACC1D
MVLNQLNVKPLHLHFPSEPNKSMVSCSLHLTNYTDDRVAFRLQIENLEEYFLGPLCGVVTPRSCYTLAVTMRHKLKLLPEFFKLESAIGGSEELTDFSSYTAVGEHDQFFTKAKQEGREVQQVKLETAYVHTEMASGGDFQLRYHDLQLGSVIIPRQYPGANPVDVHPTEPWFLIKISRFVHIWNYETQASHNSC